MEADATTSQRLRQGYFGVCCTCCNSGSAGPEADSVNGGNGADNIVSTGDDYFSILHGDAGNDTILVNSGVAYGDAGLDILTGAGTGYVLLGGADADQLYLQGAGEADGGDGSDTYRIAGVANMGISDGGSTGTDVVRFSFIESSELISQHIGNDLVFTDATDVTGSQIKIYNFYVGSPTIEQFVTLDGVTTYASDYVGL